MAEKEEKHEEGGGEEGGEGGKSKKPIIIIAAVIVVLIIIGAVVAFMMLKSGGEEAAAEANDTHTAKDDKHAKKDDKHGKKGGHGDEGKAGPMFAVDNLVINLISETGTRYAKVSVALEMDAPEAMVEMTAKKAIVQDIVITILSQKTADDLVTYKGKENAKNEILDSVNQKLKDGSVKSVYFTNFIVQ